MNLKCHVVIRNPSIDTLPGAWLEICKQSTNDKLTTTAEKKVFAIVKKENFTQKPVEEPQKSADFIAADIDGCHLLLKGVLF